MTNVLIVEDHRFFGQALARVLGRVIAEDAVFAQAASVAESLRLLDEQGPFDLVIVDLMLPDGDGSEVVREIKARNPATRVAVISAEEDLSRALAAGADEAKHKTTGLDEIIASLADLMGVPLRKDRPAT